MKVFLVSVVLQWALAAKALESSSCSSDSIEGLVAGPRYRVEQQFFSSSIADSASAQTARLGGNVWCALVSNSQQGEGLWLQVDFGVDVIIHTLRTAGYDDSFFNLFDTDNYVTSFAVMVGNTSADLQPILQETSTTEQMVFMREATPDPVDTLLPAPVTTRVLRIVVLSRYEDDNVHLCLDVEALGCVLESACNMTSPLSLDRDILPLDSIEASSPESLENLVGSGSDEWCSNQPLSEEPWIQLNFTTTVSLVYIVARGDAGIFSDDNVRAFQLEFVDEETGNFTTYGVTDEPTIFTTSSADTVVHTFWTPVQGNVFRFIITDATSNYCWNIRLHGCFLNRSAPFIEIPTTVATTTETTTTNFATTIIATTSPESSSAFSSDTDTTTVDDRQTSTAADKGSSQQLAAGIGGGVGGVVFVCIVLVAVIVLVIVFCKCTRNSPPQKMKLPEENEMPSRSVENDIYGEEIKSPEEATYQDISQPPLPSSPNMNTYESVPSAPSNNPIDSSEGLEYAYADNVVVTAKVNIDRIQASQDAAAAAKESVAVTAGFEVQPPEGQPKTTMTESLADNPLYGTS